MRNRVPVQHPEHRERPSLEAGYFSCFRNCENMIGKPPRGKRQLQAIAAVPRARQSSGVHHRRTAFPEQQLNPGDRPRDWQKRRESSVLGALRLADVVRYDSDGKHNYYRLNHPVNRSSPGCLPRFVKASSAALPAILSRFYIFPYSQLRKRGASPRMRLQTISVLAKMKPLAKLLDGAVDYPAN